VDEERLIEALASLSPEGEIADVVCAKWPDSTKPRAFDYEVLKGDELLQQSHPHGPHRDQRGRVRGTVRPLRPAGRMMRASPGRRAALGLGRRPGWAVAAGGEAAPAISLARRSPWRFDRLCGTRGEPSACWLTYSRASPPCGQARNI
jgi:hypothetical protein